MHKRAKRRQKRWKNLGKWRGREDEGNEEEGAKEVIFTFTEISIRGGWRKGREGREGGRLMKIDNLAILCKKKIEENFRIFPENRNKNKSNHRILYKGSYYSPDKTFNFATSLLFFHAFVDPHESFFLARLRDPPHAWRRRRTRRRKKSFSNFSVSIFFLFSFAKTGVGKNRSWRRRKRRRRCLWLLLYSPSLSLSLSLSLDGGGGFKEERGRKEGGG